MKLDLEEGVALRNTGVGAELKRYISVNRRKRIRKKWPILALRIFWTALTEAPVSISIHPEIRIRQPLSYSSTLHFFIFLNVETHDIIVTI